MSATNGRKPKSPKTGRVRPKAKTSPAIQPGPTTVNWKDHPVIIAGGAAAAGFVLAMGLFTQIVLPNHTVKLNNKIDELQLEASRQVQSISKLKTTLADTERKLTAANTSLKTTRQELSESRHAALFTAGNPHPNGARLIHIGTPLSTVEAVYGAKVERREDHDYVTVPLENSPFRSVVYYFDSKAKDKPIWQVLYFFDFGEDYPDDFLYRMFLAAFGSPTLTAKNKKMAWNINDKENLYYGPGDYIYLVGGKDNIPVEFYDE